MITKIKRVFDRRIITLFAVLAIAISGTASFAAMTDTLTVTSRFEGAQILVAGNDQTGTVALFNADGQVLAPGETAYASLKVTNGGNVAASFSYEPPQTVTGVGNMKDELLVQIYNPTAFRLSEIAAGNDGCDAAMIGWTPQTTNPEHWLSPNITVSSFNLNPNESRYLCYAVSLPGTAEIDLDSYAVVTQSFTGVEP